MNLLVGGGVPAAVEGSQLVERGVIAAVATAAARPPPRVRVVAAPSLPKTSAPITTNGR